MILSLLLSLIFIVLAILHFNWVIGGEYGFAESLPTKENGERVLNPEKIDSAIVGLGLTSFSLFYLYKSGIIKNNEPEWLMTYGAWIIPSIFLLRAIGDFRYIGFFKSIKNTTFGKMDTKFFSPLCLLICIIGFVVQLFYK